MNIIYTIVNRTRESKKLKPYKYIGSKTRCKVLEGKIFCLRTNKVYWSSSKYVKESIDNGDLWEIESWFEVITGDINELYQIEGSIQDSVSAKDNDIYYNKSHANLKFNSADITTRVAISNSKKGKVKPYMKEKTYWSHLQKPDVRRKNSESCKGSINVITAARKRSERQSKDPEFVKWRSELTSRTFKGRKLTEHEIWLRRHDDRYKPGRKLTNEQVWEIRFGEHKELTLNELMLVYETVSKATLSRVKNFKVFKDINEDWNSELENSNS